LKSAEINSILKGEHSFPHNFLGMHTKEDITIIRAFIPKATKITCINDTTKKEYALKKIHEDGFFELQLECSYFKYKLRITTDTTWETYDPYSFKNFITEYDIYLFKKGNHYNIYEKLGANKAIINGIEGIVFSVWAPNAKRVSVVGNFNNWNGVIHQMTNVYSSGIFEIFIPNLKNYDLYKFEIKTKNNNILLKSDPYAKFSELRPGKASFVYDISGYNWNDSDYQNKKNYPVNGPINIYEVHLGSWKRNENGDFLTYKEFADDLVDYVCEMGYTHIEILPLSEHPLDLSWGYQVTGYYSVTSRFGNPHEFMYFVDKCHNAGIGVILDWVPAHFPKDENGLINFDGTALYEHEDTRKGEHIEWGTKVFNFGRNEVSNFLISNAIFWMEIYHIDGIRIDAVSSMLYLDYNRNNGEWIPNKYGGNENEEAIEFLKHLNSIISERFPHALIIAEESTAFEGITKPLNYGGLGFNLKWNMGWMNDFLTYISKDPIHRSYHHNNITFAMMYAYTENFVLVLSHDEVVHGKASLIGKMPGDLWQKFANLRLSYGFMYGHPGKKLIFMGSEFAQFDEWKENYSLDWHLLEYDSHRNMQLYVKDLNHLYKNNSELWELDWDNKGFNWIAVNNNEQSIIAFSRHSRNDTIIIVCNFTPIVYHDYLVGVPKIGIYTEILNSDEKKYGGSGVINEKDLISCNNHAFGYDNSIKISVPPLACIFFKLK